MKLVIEISDSHMPFVRQQRDLHGPGVRIDFEHFPMQLPGRVVGALVEEASDGYKPDGTYGHVHREVVRPLEDL